MSLNKLWVTSWTLNVIASVFLTIRPLGYETGWCMARYVGDQPVGCDTYFKIAGRINCFPTSDSQCLANWHWYYLFTNQICSNLFTISKRCQLVSEYHIFVKKNKFVVLCSLQSLTSIGFHFDFASTDEFSHISVPGIRWHDFIAANKTKQHIMSFANSVLPKQVKLI